MKVRLIKRKSIEDFAIQNAASRSSFRIWLTLLKNADWTEPGAINETFGSADPLGAGRTRIVFNIAGNSFRMICKYHLGITRVHLYIKWIGTHAEYTKLCDDTKQYTIDAY